MVFATSMSPTEVNSDHEPPGWALRSEQWTIDQLLGLYEPSRRHITIFTKGIDFVAEEIGVCPDAIEYIVRIHEYAHDNQQLKSDTYHSLTEVYNSVASHVHEQIAQSSPISCSKNCTRVRHVGQQIQRDPRGEINGLLVHMMVIEKLSRAGLPKEGRDLLDLAVAKEEAAAIRAEGRETH